MLNFVLHLKKNKFENKSKQLKQYIAIGPVVPIIHHVCMFYKNDSIEN